MTVVPTGGKLTWSPLARGAGAGWLTFADAVGAPVLLAVACAVADDAGAAGPEDPLLAWA